MCACGLPARATRGSRPWDSGVPATGEDAMWLGPSYGGLQIRAAAFEPRIRRVIAMPASYSGPDMPNRHL
jgi:hypothetical protein